jgi:hypothetical protein
MPSHTKKLIPVIAILLLTGFATATSHVEMTVKESGTGFVGGELVDDSDGLDRTDPLKVDISVNNTSKYDLSQIQASDLEFSEGLSNPEIEDREKSGNTTTLTMTPTVDSYFEDSVELTFNKTSFDNATVSKSVNPLIYEWSAEKVGDSNPGRDLTYEEVEDGDYRFYFDVKHKGDSNLPESPLDDANFRLTVHALQSDNNGFSERVDIEELEGFNPDTDYNREKWMEQSQPSDDSNYNYRVNLDNMNELDKLPAGKYVYSLEVAYEAQYESQNPVYFTVDETRVDKSTEFSGAVRDSTGSGVRTEMLLNGKKNTRINTGEDGAFSTTIDQSQFDSITARFYDRGRESPDSTMVLDNPHLSENSDLGLGSAAVRYQYWNNPDNRIDGLESVNMMASKFAYPFDGVDSLSMAFDSGEVNLEKIQVYKCNFWNFDGVECMENWEKVDDSNVNVNFAALNANIDGVEPYTTPTDQDILMHAFIVGKRSDLQLQESISVESTDLTYNSELGVSGVLVDESGDRVEDADVTLSLKDADYSWNTTTDSTGTFRFDNKVDAEPGNYVLQLDAEKAPYNSLSIESDATLTVSYEKGIETEAPADQEISQGETTEISFDVTNTGQTEVEDIDVSPSGVKDQFIRNVDAPESIESGATEQVTISLALPDDYCSDTCYPELNADVEGVAGEETVSASVLLTTTLQVEQQQNQNNDSSSDGSEEEQNNNQNENTTDEQSSQQPGNETNGITGAFSEAQRMTGEFVEQQSDLNIALGLIMIFTLILAAAVKKKKDQGGDGPRTVVNSNISNRPNISGGTSSADSRVQRPDVSSKQRDKQESVSEERSGPREQEETESESTEEPMEPDDEEVDEQEGASEDSEETDEEVPDDVCDICGEEFESATGVKIHKQAVH